MRLDRPYSTARSYSFGKSKHILAPSSANVNDYIAGLRVVDVKPIVPGIPQKFGNPLKPLGPLRIAARLPLRIGQIVRSNFRGSSQEIRGTLDGAWMTRI